MYKIMFFLCALFLVSCDFGYDSYYGNTCNEEKTGQLGGCCLEDSTCGEENFKLGIVCDHTIYTCVDVHANDMDRLTKDEDSTMDDSDTLLSD